VHHQRASPATGAEAGAEAKPMSRIGFVLRPACDSAETGATSKWKETGVRKVIVSEWMSLDGVVQAPAYADEDTSGGFEHGGWHLRYFDDMSQRWVADLHVIGSTRLVRTLIEHDLADEFRLMIDPVLVGGGKRVFLDDGVLRQLRLTHSQVTATGAILATYARAKA